MADKKREDGLLSEEEKHKIVARLRERGVPQRCPMCGKNKWAIGDGYVNQTIQGDYHGIHIGGTSIPSIPIICSNCGFLSHHALGVLGLLEKPKAEGDGK